MWTGGQPSLDRPRSVGAAGLSAAPPNSEAWNRPVLRREVYVTSFT